MSLTEKKKKISAGFSLIEMIVVITLLGLIAVISSGFMLVSLRASNKAEITKRVRQSGNYALSVMEGIILSARSVECQDNKIYSTDIYQATSIFECISNERIASIAAIPAGTTAPLTGPDVKVIGCVFTCDETEGRPTKVNVKFTVEQRLSEGSANVSEKASVTFDTDVLTRNID